MSKHAEDVFRELKEDVSTFAELKLELIKLNAYEQIGKLIAVLSYGLLLSALIIIATLFALLAFGFLLSALLGSTAAGFGIVTAIYLIQILLVVRYKNHIRRRVINIIIAALNSNEEKEDGTIPSQPES
jgi:mannose/fructose/N-acetylgalactosamine-specific phosphotransferase system component IIC